MFKTEAFEEIKARIERIRKYPTDLDIINEETSKINEVIEPFIEKVSNCCSAKVENGVCADCNEHCLTVETE